MDLLHDLLPNRLHPSPLGLEFGLYAFKVDIYIS